MSCKKVSNKNSLSFTDIKAYPFILNKDKRAEDNSSPFLLLFHSLPYWMLINYIAVWTLPLLDFHSR